MAATYSCRACRGPCYNKTASCICSPQDAEMVPATEDEWPGNSLDGSSVENEWAIAQEWMNGMVPATFEGSLARNDGTARLRISPETLDSLLSDMPKPMLAISERKDDTYANKPRLSDLWFPRNERWKGVTSFMGYHKYHAVFAFL